MHRIIVSLVALVLASPAVGLDSSAGPLRAQPVITGLDEPWGLAFLPEGGLLVTERGGRLLHVDGQSVTNIRGVPRVRDAGQGGLLDVMVPRDFAASREVFVTFAMPQGAGEGTALAKGRLSEAGNRLENVEVIFEMSPGSEGGRHFGSRVVEGADGYLYISIGDRGDRPSAQDLRRHNGSIIRIARDGSVPDDNPFVGEAGVQPEIWSYGHRNPQGMGVAPDGTIYTAEHGARGGDEVNRIERGVNYGWPVISYGTHYSGARIGEGTEAAGMAQPEFYWDPSIAPSGLMVYSGRLWPEWEGDIFVGSLKFGLISRLDTEGGIREVERIEGPETERVRDIREGPDGAIWFLSVGNGALYRVTPGGAG
ncbi:MAG: PQQ-dependent sugar dehydrogenase [Paracoccaceae bacterium]|nr:PQQ-dependent sugar dehydrogenase [Paracoccaceae bacterium]